MVRLHIKRGDESQFLYDTTVNEDVEKLIQEICAIFNGRLKISRLSDEIKYLSDHGAMLPPEMIGLTDEQVEDLKLKDIWADKCIPSGGYDYNKDEIGRRNGRRPKAEMRKVLNNAIEQSREMVDKKLVLTNTPLTLKKVQEALDILKGAVTIVYPMQLPPHDNIRMEFTNTEDLSGTQALKDIIEPANAQLWFAGHQILPGKLLKDAVGTNDKTKVIIKLTKCNEGAPGREPVMTENIRKQLMLQAYRREQELKWGTPETVV